MINGEITNSFVISRLFKNSKISLTFISFGTIVSELRAPSSALITEHISIFSVLVIKPLNFKTLNDEKKKNIGEMKQS